MWSRFLDIVRCPFCRHSLELVALEQREAALSDEQRLRGEQLGLSASELGSAVDAGLLVCGECKLWFPILQGLPILLPYTTRSHEEFLAAHGAAVAKLGAGFDTPSETPMKGEEFVLQSNSREWLDYRYDCVVSTFTYEERERLFLDEMGSEPAARTPARFIEIGCGIGLVTSFAARHFPGDAIGVDLTLAAMRAAGHFRDDPFAHFVQTSLWYLPFERESFDLVYSHGVLHHTYSTEGAFKSVAPLCSRGGRMYVWVYGDLATRETASRRLAYGIEELVRPVFSRLPPGVTRVALAPFALGYLGINWLERNLLGRKPAAYDYKRALGAARDRLTPLYAFYTSPEQVGRWFREAGFRDLHLVTEDQVSEVARDAMRRNVGMRAVRA